VKIMANKINLCDWKSAEVSGKSGLVMEILNSKKIELEA
jgi:hypothetical protein